MITLCSLSAALGIFLTAPPSYLIAKYGVGLSIAGLLLSGFSIGLGIFFSKASIKKVVMMHFGDSAESLMALDFLYSTIQGISYTTGPLIGSIITHFYRFISSCQIMGLILIAFATIYLIGICTCFTNRSYQASIPDEDTAALLKKKSNLNSSIDKYSVQAFRESPTSIMR